MQELQGVDVMHKFNWIRLISRMFEAMAGNFAHPEDIQLFLNVLSGSLALHAGDSVILRHGRWAQSARAGIGTDGNNSDIVLSLKTLII